MKWILALAENVAKRFVGRKNPDRNHFNVYKVNEVNSFSEIHKYKVNDYYVIAYGLKTKALCRITQCDVKTWRIESTMKAAK
jgi:hypothetical protein